MEYEVGQWINNRYRVDKVIAHTKMSVLYKVFDKDRNRHLVMKTLSEDLAEDPVAMEMIKRGAAALQNLVHPNIVPFYGVEQTGEDVFTLMLFVEGMSLKDILKSRKGQPLPTMDALIYFKAFCSALGYAHLRNVVHCDVKPDNLLVDAGGLLYLTDFDIARHAESTHTDYGVVGTSYYMAPEQFSDEGVVTPATDVYALGVLLFEMLTGRRPFTGKEVSTETSGKTIRQVMEYNHTKMPPPDPRSINPDIPEALAWVILRALVKMPSGRYQSTIEFFEAACQAAGIPSSSVPDRINPATLAAVTSSSGQRTVTGPHTGPQQGPVTNVQTWQAQGQQVPPPEEYVPAKRKPWKAVAVIGVGLCLVLLTFLVVNGAIPIPGLVKTPVPTTIPTRVIPTTAVVNLAATNAKATEVAIQSLPTQAPTRAPTRTPRPTATRTRPPLPTATRFATPQPAIDSLTVDPGQCPYHTHLQRGMYAFALEEVAIYDIPRYDDRVLPYPKQLYTLKPGDRVLISIQTYPGSKNPQCMRNTYFWFVQTAFEDPTKDPHIEGWAFEYYYYHQRDAFRYWNEGYYLGPYPP